MYQSIKSDTSYMLVFEDRYNKRIRIDEYSGDVMEIIQLIQKRITGWVGKIIVKVPAGDEVYFTSNGYLCEAKIPGYFSGKNMSFLVKFPDRSRFIDINSEREQSIISNIMKLPPSAVPSSNKIKKIASIQDVNRIADFFDKIFKIYPTPITNPAYIEKMMLQGTVFIFIEEKNEIISMVSAEINTRYSNAELTDCATLEKYRGRGYNRILLNYLEELLNQKGTLCQYTIARSSSIGINKVFYNLGFTFSGRMKNNCYIYSGLENMNVWYKTQKLNE